MSDDIRELNLDNLAEVNGGTSPVKPSISNHILMGMRASINNNEMTGQEVATEVKAFCRNCGSPVKYLGQERVEGGLTGKFMCTNTSCKECNVIKYNDEVNK